MEQISNQLTLSAEAFPVKTLASPRQLASASSVNAPDSGRNIAGYSQKYGLDLRLLKMYPPFAVVGLPWSYKISTRSGLMRSGIVFPLRPLARLTRETDALSCPTLRACSGKRSSGANRTEIYRLFQRMPTLTAADAFGGPGNQGRDGGLNLRTAVRLPTLTANRWSGLQSHGENALLGPLNPAWCEWYMGFPIGWTDLDHLEIP